MIDLFALAQARVPRIIEDFETAVAALPTGDAERLRRFAEWTEANAVISINVDLFVVTELLNGRAYQNIYEWADEQSHMSGRAAGDILRERLKEWFDRRLRFDAGVSNGRTLRYGAMSGGTIGLKEYGSYCLVMTRAFQEALLEIAYWPGDSLVAFWRADGSLDRDTLVRKISPHAHRHLMVACERAGEVANDPQSWPSLIASDERYFEAAFAGEVRLESVGCLRVLRSEYERLVSLAFENFGRRLGDAERALVHDFVQLRRAVLNEKIKLEVVQ